jgi:hypothetical protein
VSARSIVIGLAAALVFALGLAIDPAGLVQWAWYCGTGGCGVRPLWLAASLGAALAACIVVALIRRATFRRSPPRRGRAGIGRKQAAKPKAKPAARRKSQARA